jgi:stalled ribosome rescue protein Dom34
MLTSPELSENPIMPKHVAIWIDHKEARVFHIHPDKIDEATVTAPHHVHHKHPKGPEGVKEHPNDAKQFFHEVGQSLEGTEEILVVGPSTAKLEFLRYLHKHDHSLETRIVGIETVDHPTDGQLVAYAKKYFKLSDRIR